MKSLIFVLAVTAFWQSAYAVYRAAVVEYSPLTGSTPNSTVETNINEYVRHIEAARVNNVEIIVFPEYGLTGLIEDPTDYAIEITNNERPFENYWLQRLSNAALEHGLYVVVNLLEKATDANNGTVYYNTNIVFDKRGTIIAKYRKINLYYEPRLTPGNDIVTFTTDFGVVFGIITCNDILFSNPSRAILNGSLSDVIYTAAWTSTLPFYHSLSVQSGYAQANQINLLAANLNNPSRGLSGSGIYGHDGSILSHYISGLSSSKLLVSDVSPQSTPKNPFTPFGFDILNDTNPSELHNFITVRDFQHPKYQFKQIDFSKGEVHETLCYGSYCCNFKVISSEVNATEVYQLVVYNGPSKIGDHDYNIRICTLVACETADKSTCGSRNLNLTTKFSEISVSGDFRTESEHFYQPVSLTTDLLPIYNTTYSSGRVNESISISFNTTRSAEKVIAFGIYGRGAATTFGSSIVFLVVLSILKYLF